MLDRDGVCQNSYYQPGFGTYVSSTWLARNPGRIKSWYLKAKDAAVGSTYSQHVQAGYEFLVRYYTPGDSIYIFGFSRGAFIARLVAEMLDHIGLLECGNEELIRFCWETFGTWKRGETSRGMNPKKRERQHKFMQAFRETFCRPVPQIRFLGLFDIVNSVPRIEMMRSRLRYPFTTRTSAKMIRHAVSIDERRTRFRNELISDIHPRAGRGSHKFRRRFWPWHKHASVKGDEKSGESEGGSPGPSWPNMFYRRGHRSRLRDASVSSQWLFEYWRLTDRSVRCGLGQCLRGGG